MTKIICPKCNGKKGKLKKCGNSKVYIPCQTCKGKGWIPHPTCNQCDKFYLEDMGHPSKVAKCRVTGLVVHPMGYCHVHSELLEE